MHLTYHKSDRKVKAASAAKAEGAGAPDNEVTPEMIEAGADVIWRSFGDVLVYGSGTGRDVASEVYLAMASVRDSKQNVS